MKHPRPVLASIALAIVWAAALYALAFAAEASLSSSRDVDPAAPFARWDSPWYAKIASGGYEGRTDGRMHNIAFFPLYPASVAAVSRATGLSPYAAGEGVSFAALLGAVALLVLLAREEGFDGPASVRALLWFPTAFFFLGVYTESLYLLVSAACLLALRRRKYPLAVVAGFLAGLCRPNGFLLSVPAAWALFDRRSPSPSPPDGRSRFGILLTAAAPVLGLAAFLGYSGWKLGDPFLPITIQRSGWKHSFTWPWRTLAHGWLWPPRMRFEVIVTLLFLGAAALLWKEFKGYSLYVVLVLLLPCMSAQLFSVSRYVLVLFPIFFLLGNAFRRHPWIEAAYATGSLLGLAYLTIRFALGRWVA